MAVALATGASMFEQFSAQIRHLQTQLQTRQQIRVIAVLLDAQNGPAMLVTFDPQERALQIQRLNNVAEGREDSLQLWALPPAGSPRSLGILTKGLRTGQLPVEAAALAEVSRLAVSVEDKGGATPGAGPRLPYLFSGAVVHKAL